MVGIGRVLGEHSKGAEGYSKCIGPVFGMH